jgi:hypothetical protein
MAEPLRPQSRAAFLEALAAELARHPADERGPGLLHRLGRDLQRQFLKMVRSRSAARASSSTAGPDKQGVMRRARRALEWFDDDGFWIAREPRKPRF